jgi:hypothetical protein
MRLKRSDHICALYTTTADLAQSVARFPAEGLDMREQ